MAILIFVTKFLFIIPIFVLSCQGETEDSINESSLLGTIDKQIEDSVYTTRKIEVDSTTLLNLEDAWENDEYLTDNINSDEMGLEYYSLVDQKADFTGDGVEDYFVLIVDFHHVRGEFYDGKTGAVINGMDTSTFTPNTMFYSRPYPNESEEGVITEVIELDNSNGKQNLLVYYHSGPPHGSSIFQIYAEIYEIRDESIFTLFSTQLFDSEDKTYRVLEFDSSKSGYPNILVYAGNCEKDDYKVRHNLIEKLDDSKPIIYEYSHSKGIYE